MINYIALAVPGFFVAILIELLVARRRGVRVYRFADAYTDISCGLAQQLVVIFVRTLTLAPYVWVYERAGLIDLPANEPLTWVVAMVGVDFLYYWWHRMSHEVNVLWAAHVVHHQSEDYNLAVALRQSVLSGFTTIPFYLPLALVGVPPLVFASSVAFSTLYQFWIHTQLIGKMGPLELVLNTPSHHRVHHAVNGRYLDRNHAAILIVWDRLFGTFAEEREQPHFGLVKPLGTFNAAWAQVHYWLDIVRLGAAARRVSDRLYAWVASPAWSPGVGVRDVGVEEERPKYEVEVSTPMQIYLVAHGVLVSAAVTSLLLWGDRVPPLTQAMMATATGLLVVTAGGLMEKRRWAAPVEAVRVVMVVVAVAMVARGIVS